MHHPCQKLLYLSLLFVSADNQRSRSSGMAKRSLCYKPCASCNSAPRAALQALRPRQEVVFLLSFFFPPFPFLKA